MLDRAELERTLDLWASMWQPRERVLFERALERVVDGHDTPASLRAAAMAACRVIATPRLVAAAMRAAAELEPAERAEVEAVAEPLGRLCAHAARVSHDEQAVLFWLDKVLRDPGHPAADKLLDRVDIRALWTLLQSSDDDRRRAELSRRLSRRGPHQRARLLQALDLDGAAFDAELAVDVPLDDLGAEELSDADLDDLVV